MLANLRSQLLVSIEKALNSSFPLSEQTPTLTLEVPADKKHGEFSCNVAMRLSGVLKRNPMEIAEALRGAIARDINAGALKEKIDKVEVKKPGFINFYFSKPAFYKMLAQVITEANNYGRSNTGKKVKVQIEFVSANPTGPLSVAHARQAAMGDALGNIFQFLDFAVTKEFYVNDEGNQINILGRSIECRARELLGEPVEFPEEGYQGDYIRDMAREFLEKNNVRSLEALKKIEPPQFIHYGVDHLLGVIKQELEDFGVHFDVWSHQSSIATDKQIQATLKALEQKQLVYEKEGALWFKSTNFGDDKDRVVRKSDGSYTYLTPDIVYHRNKFERGFAKVFNIWGPDHHGYIPRIKAAVQALGQDADALEVLIVQLATISRAGKPLSMSTRRGQYISLREVINEVGVDAARFFFLMRHINAHLDFDLELAKKETPENPVYYVQYAHARINSILRKAAEAGLKAVAAGFQNLGEEEELDLIRKLSTFSDVLEICAAQRDPFALVSYVQELATAFHRFYDRHQVIGEESRLSGERLGLIEAVKIVIANGLHLLGVEAPEKM
jgi:arginyl-tRNA synthetase